MKLSTRQQPSVPATPAEWAAQWREMYAILNGELDELVGDVSQDQANFRDQAGSWNVKETIAHLIITERYGHEVIGAAIIDAPLPDFSGDQSERTGAMAAVYEAMPALLAELKRAQEETLCLIEALPAAVVSRKGSYTLLYQNLNYVAGHHRNHFDQVRNLLEAAHAA